MSTRSSFGKIRKLPSGRFQASYAWPPTSGQRVNGPITFLTKGDAAAWLAAEQTDRARGVETPVAARRREPVPTFAVYAERWLTLRSADNLSANTISAYRRQVRGRLIPAFGALRLDEIKVATVGEWFGSFGADLAPTRAKAYRALMAIMKLAIDEGLIGSSPCRVKRGSVDPRRDHHVVVATPAQVGVIADAMPARWRLMVLLGSYCQLRFGEIAELRRKDIEIDGGRGVIRVRRAMVRVDRRLIIGPPKSEAGRRNVSIPPHLVPVVAAHLANYALSGRDGLLFTTAAGRQVSNGMVHRAWKVARAEADLPELHFHDLRHAGITWLARNGATTRERMRRVGHSTPAMVLRYEHADDERDALLAERLSADAPVAGLRKVSG